MHRFIKNIYANATRVGNGLMPAQRKSPDELLGELFQDVQLRRIYPDGMTFVDLVPGSRLAKVLKEYRRARQDPGFDLHQFVAEHFKEYLDHPQNYKTNPKHTVEEHILELWDVLTRKAYANKGSLIALPYPYIVPGGRFVAQWYWDSYFTMLGLAASDRWDLVEGMVKNCASMIRKVGFVPSGNRTYYLSRSQPPFFALMVRLLAEKHGNRVLVRYLPYIMAEYSFWMKGSKKLHSGTPVFRRAVRMPDGSLLNRYYDNRRTPRPEMYKDDVDTALCAPDRLPSKVYLDLRAGAESGWDFSSRWFKDDKTLATIHATDIVPVDLNCLLYMLEQTIADAYMALKQGKIAKTYQNKAAARAAAIQKYCWDETLGFYFDYDLITSSHTPALTLAGVFPLYARMASQEQADAVAAVIRKRFLKTGGVVTTLITSGQQWDAPNGWAPLQWVTIQGLRNYGHNDLADEIKQRWIATNLKVYKEQGKLVEKYNVVDPTMSAGGGEYVLQDGFGWTNGVLMALLRE